MLVFLRNAVSLPYSYDIATNLIPYYTHFSNNPVGASLNVVVIVVVQTVAVIVPL